MFWERLRNIAGKSTQQDHCTDHVITPNRCYTPPHPLECNWSLLGEGILVQEHIEGFKVLYFQSGELQVIARAVAAPSNQILPTVSSPTTVEDAINKVFLLSFGGDDRSWARMGARREESVVIGDEGVKERGMESRVNGCGVR